MRLSAEDEEALRYAKALLENPGFAARLTSLIGMPIEKALKLLPDKWAEVCGAGSLFSSDTGSGQ